MRNGRNLRHQHGITYLGVLILVATLGLSLSMAAQVLSQSIRRDKEQQLLWVGHAYRAAIEAYVKKRGAYPTNLEALLGQGPFQYIGLPLKWRGGTGSPIRAVAVFDN